MTTRLSVIIPTYNREEVLCSTLAAVLPLITDCFELIVVDQTRAHTPETERFLKTREHRMSRYRVPWASLPRARNYGTARARGDVVLFLDDDVVPCRDLLERHLANYDDPSIGGVAGRVLGDGSPGPGRGKWVGRVTRSGKVIANFGATVRCEVDTARGCNMSFRRALIQKAMGFDERFIGNAVREETDLCVRLRKLGVRLVFDPTAVLDHREAADGGCRGAGREAQWYEHLFHNETLFSLKHCGPAVLPLLLVRMRHAMSDCVLHGGKLDGGRFAVVWRGFRSGYLAYRAGFPPSDFGGDSERPTTG